MILGLLAALASATPEAAAPDRLASAFIDVCLDGAGRFAKGELTPVTFPDLPGTLRRRLGRPKSGQVWRINGAGSSFLYVLEFQPTGGNHPKICGLASTSMPLVPAAEALERRVDGYPIDDKLRSMEWWRPQDGYAAIATTASAYNVLQILWLSEAQRKKSLKQLRHSGVRIPRPKD